MRAVVKTTIASMRDEPRADVALTDEVLYGMVVEILGKPQNGWYKIRTDYNYEGYLSESDLLLDQVLTKKWEHLSYKRIIQSYADVLTEPRVQGVLIQGLTRGAVIHAITQEEDGWIRVMLCDGTIGFIKEKFLGTFFNKPSGHTEEEFRQNIVQTAKSYLGTQYRWGGKTPLGIDCSGLTSICYLMNGVTIYRDANIKEGFPVHEIAFEDKKPGDLLFFKGHTALYLGENRYIHSTGKNGIDGVVMNSFDPEAVDYREDLAKGINATGSIF